MSSSYQYSYGATWKQDSTCPASEATTVYLYRSHGLCWTEDARCMLASLRVRSEDQRMLMLLRGGFTFPQEGFAFTIISSPTPIPRKLQAFSFLNDISRQPPLPRIAINPSSWA